MLHTVNDKTKLKMCDYMLDDCVDYLSNLKCVSINIVPFIEDKNKIKTIEVGDSANQWIIHIDSISWISFKRLGVMLSSKLVIGYKMKKQIRLLMECDVFLTKIWDIHLAQFILKKGLKLNDLSLKSIMSSYSINTNVYEVVQVDRFEDLMNRQKDEIKRNKIQKTVSVEMSFCVVLSYIENCGIHIDKDKWTENNNNAIESLKDARDRLDAFVFENALNVANTQMSLFDCTSLNNINWNSSNEVVKIKSQINNEATLLELNQMLSKFNKLSSYVTTYGVNWIEHIDKSKGRLYTVFNQITDTGRVSCSDSDYNNHNIQGIPNNKNTRECFTAQYASSNMTSADYKEMEMVVLANVSKEQNMISLYKTEGFDMYCYMASKNYKGLSNLTVNDIKDKYPEQRRRAKIDVFSLIYGGSGTTIAKNRNISIKEGVDFEYLFFNEFPTLKKFFNSMFDRTINNRYILNDFKTNSKLYVNNITEITNNIKHYDFNNNKFWNKYNQNKKANNDYYIKEKDKYIKHLKQVGELKRVSQNYIIQGTSAVIMKIALILFYKWIVKNELLDKVLIPNIIFDEILTEQDKGLSEVVEVNLRRCMVKASSYFCKSIPLDVSVATGQSWYN